MKHFLLLLPLILVSCQSIPKDQDQRNTCSENELTYGTTDFIVNATRYADTQPSNKAILVLPPTGGVTYLDRRLSERFCRAGFDVFILTGWTGFEEQSDDLRLHDRLFTRALRAINETLKRVPAKGFAGILGTSVGATYVAVAMSQIDRLDAGFSIVGGAPIPGIIVMSDQKAMRGLRERRYEKFDFKNDEDYLQTLTGEFPLDPFKNEKKFVGKHLGMAIATKDTTVPVQYQRELQQLWNPNPVYEIHTGHFWGIVGTWWEHDKDIVQFFIKASHSSP